MRDVIVLSHKRTVGSGAALADALGVRCVTPKNTRPIPPDTLLINYGVSAPLPWVAQHPVALTLNCPVPVAKAVHKRRCLDVLYNEGISTLEYTTDIWQAMEWLSNGPASRRKVFARTLVAGSQGRGIHIFEDSDDMMNEHGRRAFKLFTRNVPKTKEYRVHVVNGKAIHMSQKRAMSDAKLAELGIKGVDRAIRSYKNGWVFANELQGTPEQLELVANEAERAVDALGLDFGAVDMLALGVGPAITGWKVCEVNTAPSLDGNTTLQSYVNAIQEGLRHEN